MGVVLVARAHPHRTREGWGDLERRFDAERMGQPPPTVVVALATQSLGHPPEGKTPFPLARTCHRSPRVPGFFVCPQVPRERDSVKMLCRKQEV